MYTKSIAALVASAALAQQALAFNSHRHLHGRDLPKDDNKNVVEVFTTVLKYEYVMSQPPATAVPAADSHPEDCPPEDHGNVPSPVAQPSVAPQEVPPKKEPPQEVPPQEVQPKEELPKQEPPKQEPPKQEPPKQEQHQTAPSGPAGSTPPPSGDGKGGSDLGFPKRGIAFNDNNLLASFSKECGSKCGWCHNWVPTTHGEKVDCNFIPTLKCNTEDFTKGWAQQIESAIKSGAKVAFGFNEPDNKGECNITPEAAAKSYIELMNPYHGQIKLCAPAISNSNLENEGIQWLQKFLKACNGECKIDYAAAHWYGKRKDIPSFAPYIKSVSDAFSAFGSLQVWIGEFSLIDDTDVFTPIADPDFMAQMTKELDGNPLVAGYSAFYAKEGLLMAGNGLSPAGKSYVNA